VGIRNRWYLRELENYDRPNLQRNQARYRSSIKAWTKGLELEDAARQQLLNVVQLPSIYKWVAAMPEVHWGIGATVGSVIPTRGSHHSCGCGC
jgi:hypothetical protein